MFHNHTVGNDLVLLNRNPDGYYNTVRIDAAFIPIEDPNVIIKNRIQTLNGTIMNVTYGDLSDTPRWSKVNIYGAINNDDGWLLFKNATLALGMRTVSNMGVATYDSKMGDSGAAIIHHNATGSHNLIGLHSGGVCVFNSPSEGQLPMINVTSSRFCDGNNDVYYYKIFSAWENVLSVLNIK